MHKDLSYFQLIIPTQIPEVPICSKGPIVTNGGQLMARLKRPQAVCKAAGNRRMIQHVIWDSFVINRSSNLIFEDFSYDYNSAGPNQAGLVRAQSWPVVRAQPITLWPSSSPVQSVHRLSILCALDYDKGQQLWHLPLYSSFCFTAI